MSWMRVACMVLLGTAVLMPGCGGAKEVEYKSDVDKMTPEHRALVEQMKRNQDNQGGPPMSPPQQNRGAVQPPSGS